MLYVKIITGSPVMTIYFIKSTAFTISQLLKGNQQGDGATLPPDWV